MLFLGVCPKCHTQRSRYDELDRGARGRRVVCWVCGWTTAWLNRDGTLYEPPPWVPDGRLRIFIPADPDGANGPHRRGEGFYIR